MSSKPGLSVAGSPISQIWGSPDSLFNLRVDVIAELSRAKRAQRSTMGKKIW